MLCALCCVPLCVRTNGADRDPVHSRSRTLSLHIVVVVVEDNGDGGCGAKFSHQIWWPCLCVVRFLLALVESGLWMLIALARSRLRAAVFCCWCVGCFVCFVSVYGFCGLGSEFICNRRSCWPSEHAHNLIGLHWAGREISVWKRTAKYDYLNIVENNACRTQWIDCVDAVLLVQSCMNTKLNMIRRRLLLTKCIFIKTYA